MLLLSDPRCTNDFCCELPVAFLDLHTLLVILSWKNFSFASLIEFSVCYMYMWKLCESLYDVLLNLFQVFIILTGNVYG